MPNAFQARPCPPWSPACVTVGWLVLATTLAAAQGLPVPDQPQVLAARFYPDGDTTKAIIMTTVGAGMVRVFGKDWEGGGLTDGKSYWGEFHVRDSRGTTVSSGTHKGTVRRDGSIVIHGRYTEGRESSFDVVWKRAPRERGQPVPSVMPSPWSAIPRIGPPDVPPELPGLGEYVYVEELPEAITKVPPAYPAQARKARVEGTVMVGALVGKDGRVRRTKIIRSIPELDEAAVVAVRQWVFKPARSMGSPVAVWVAVPVKFSLK